MSDQPTEFIAKPEEAIVNAYTQGSFTMLPSKKVLFFRHSFLWQFVRFIIINIRMTIMILKSHKSSGVVQKQ